MEACFQKRFIACGIGFEHAQPPFLGRLGALCIELPDQHLDVVLQELLADLSAALAARFGSGKAHAKPTIPPLRRLIRRPTRED